MPDDRHLEWRCRIGKDRTFWARGYYASTVGPDEAEAGRYIAEQENGGAF